MPYRKASRLTSAVRTNDNIAEAASQKSIMPSFEFSVPREAEGQLSWPMRSGVVSFYRSHCIAKYDFLIIQFTNIWLLWFVFCLSSPSDIGDPIIIGRPTDQAMIGFPPLRE
jgi:hypothetical protein